ncbi:MAG TPA: nucleoside deaminase [Acetobacteraceae bacterium]|nr:nucleoside deaminase [Acetobacteraceae bacterium]
MSAPFSAPLSAMEIALAEAASAAERGEVPVGAVVLDAEGAMLARAGNRMEQEDAASHAELLALTAAARALGQPRLAGCDLIVTLEPCPMCAAAASLFRIRRLVFGAYDPKGGGVEHGPRIFSAPTCNHRPEVIGGVREAECAALLRSFFAGLRPER